MLEFYCAYMDVNGMMDFCEKMLRTTVERATGNTRFRVGEIEIDLEKPFKRLSMKEAIEESEWFNDLTEWKNKLFGEEALDNPHFVRKLSGYSDRRKEPVIDNLTGERIKAIVSNEDLWEEVENEEALLEEPTDLEIAKYIENIFSSRVETDLIEPTFIVDFPKPISPLSKASPQNPSTAERFELFINMMEIANGFSELNDPQEQRERFEEQMKQRERGDEEAMVLDEDYIRALSYGMPPAAGIGIGVDRLVMLLTNKRSIRDVILFPHMRPERKRDEQAEETSEQE
jgi:lysyl-tRNA synthetase, class II